MFSKTTVRASAGDAATLASAGAAMGRAAGFNFLIEIIFSRSNRATWRLGQNNSPCKKVIERLKRFERLSNFVEIQLKIGDELGAARRQEI
jgi:hypothetical protein